MGTLIQNGHALFWAWPRNEKIISRLLKVVQTWFWASNDRKSRLYNSTYNNPKLPDLPFSRNLQKTKFAIDAKLENSKIGGFWH